MEGWKLNVECSKFSPQQGVALVVTVILISVITFLTIAFLALSRREKGAVTVATDQNIARLAAEAGLVDAQVRALGPILAANNAYYFDVLVTTNYVNPLGYVNGVNDPTNVNYEAAAALNNPTELARNIANLLYNPRPPVFVTNYLAGANGSNEFRFYHDLNRNGRYDHNGLAPVISPNLTYYDTNGVEIGDARFPPPPGMTVLSNYFIGDPEWIGMLARPDRPHSATNDFVSRFTYFIVPAGKTLDINYIHNQARNPNKATLDTTYVGGDFLRNQGVGTWEINLAAFFYDLNTNRWGETAQIAFYNPLLGLPASGNAVIDAGNIYRYRINGPRSGIAALDNAYTPNLLFSANRTLASAARLGQDFVDDYSAGPLMVSSLGLANDLDGTRLSLPWPGSENSNHVFSTQDYFDPRKTSVDFVNRLTSLGNTNSSYDRTTYYRLLSQLGTDSAPEQDKLNLNYKNIGGLSATNMVPWTAADFFTNAADKLIRRFTTDWVVSDAGGFVSTFATNRAFGVTDIPVVLSNRFVYTPSINRLLQLAANLYDASTNRVYNAAVDFPSVFRPVFRRQGSTVVICGYQSVDTTSGWNDPIFSVPLDLTDAADFNTLANNSDNFVNVYGVPWIIGAKKGFPNFNEFAISSTFELTRKLEIQRASSTQKGMNGNMRMKYVLSLTNVVGMELWNSYQTNYNRPLEVAVQHEMSMVLTNDQPGFAPFALRTLTPAARTFTLPANAWRGYAQSRTNSFFPLLTNVPFLPESTYLMASKTLSQNPNLPFENGQGFPFPRWGFGSTNRLRVIMRDPATGRVIDYVQLNELDAARDLSEEVRTGGYDAANDDPNFERWNRGMWNTNRPPTIVLPYQGITNQLLASIGSYGNNPPESAWQDYGTFQVRSGGTVQTEIESFRQFYLGLPGNTNLVVQVPYTPTARYKQYLTWQANDPLVHYMPGDLEYLLRSNGIAHVSLKLPLPRPENIGYMNQRYRPWGGNPEAASFGETQTDKTAFDVARKDPGMQRSDNWDFPTNKFANVGWMGRVHRGSPWQTVYLKSADIAEAEWQNWTGNDRKADSLRNRPVGDRMLFDLFTTALNENATRGQLPVNQTNLAAWSAVLSGVVVMTNSSPNDPTLATTAFPSVIQPVGARGTNCPLGYIVNGIVRTHANTNLFPTGTFLQTGDVLAVPELTDQSPFINHNGTYFTRGLNDAVYEWLPQQIMSLLRLGEPRFVVYAFGQTLRPAARVPSGPFAGLCTNYQITAEAATRAVFRVEGAPTNSHVVVESYNLLPPD